MQGQQGRPVSSSRDSSSSSPDINTGGSTVICHRMTNASPSGGTPLQNGTRGPQLTCQEPLSHQGLRRLLSPDSAALPSAQGKPQRTTAPKGEKAPDRPVRSPGSPPQGEEHQAETTCRTLPPPCRTGPSQAAPRTCTPNLSPSTASALWFYMFW